MALGFLAFALLIAIEVKSPSDDIVPKKEESGIGWDARTQEREIG
jgi:hypothetical protein